MAKLKALYIEYTLALLLLVAGTALTLTAAAVYQQHHVSKVRATFVEAAQDRASFEQSLQATHPAISTPMEPT